MTGNDLHILGFGLEKIDATETNQRRIILELFKKVKLLNWAKYRHEEHFKTFIML